MPARRLLVRKIREVFSVNYFGLSCCLIGGCYPPSSE